MIISCLSMLLKMASSHFLWVSNIPVCVYMCVCVCVHTHIFIHSSRCLGVFFLMLDYMNSLYILDCNLLPDTLFANISSHSVGCLFVLLIVFFAVKKRFSFWCSTICLFLLLFPLPSRYIQKKLLRLMSKSILLLIFSSESVMDSGFTHSLFFFLMIIPMAYGSSQARVELELQL